MAIYSAAQIAKLARDAGFNNTGSPDLDIAVAVALAESGGRSDARGDVGLQTDVWGPSIGLWQVRSLKSQTGTGSVRDQLANLDPVHNARAAFAIFKAAGYRWHPWSTYTNNAYRAHLDQARSGVAAVSPDAPGAPGGTAAPANPYEAVKVVRWASPAPWNSSLSGIAGRYRTTWQTIWNDPRNEGLRHARGTPDKIQPGDLVYVRVR